MIKKIANNLIRRNRVARIPNEYRYSIINTSMPIITTNEIIDKALEQSDNATKTAFALYNASKYPSKQIMYNSIPVNRGRNITTNKTKITPSSYGKSGDAFVRDIYNSYYKALRAGAASDIDAKRQARFLAQKAAFETGYGKSIANTHNYGGHRTKEKGWLAFNSMDDYTTKDVALLDKKWSNWRNSKTDKDFVKAITTNNGYGIYAPESEYQRYYGLSNRVNNYLNMNGRSLRCGGRVDRPKAWIGAAIGAATSILGGVLSSNAQKKQERELRRQREHQAAIQQAEAMNTSLATSQQAQTEFENRFRLNYGNGGRIKASFGLAEMLPILGGAAGSLLNGVIGRSKKNNIDIDEKGTVEDDRLIGRNGVRITDGGPFINSSTGRLYRSGDKLPIGTYEVPKYTHEQKNPSGKTGNGLNANGKKFEVEKGERVKVRNGEVFVLSDTLKIPTPYGYDTPANAERNGVNNNYVEYTQQAMNGNYGMKRSLKNGGRISRPVERIKADDGLELQYINGNWQKKTKYPNTNRYYWQIISNDEAKQLKAKGYTVNKTPKTANPPRQVGDAKKELATHKAKNNTGKPLYPSYAYQQAMKEFSIIPKTNNKFDDSLTNETTVYGRTLPEPVIIGRRRNKPVKTSKATETPAVSSIPATKTSATTIKNTAQSNGSRANLDVLRKPITLGNDVANVNTKIDNTIDNGLAIAALPSNGTRRSLTTAGKTTTPGLAKSAPVAETPIIETSTTKSYKTTETPAATPAPSIASATSGRYLGSNITKSPWWGDAVKAVNDGLEESKKPKEPKEPVTGTDRPTSRLYNEDLISFGADLANSLGSAYLNYKAADNIKDPYRPVDVLPSKMITNWNIAPRLSRIGMMRNSMLKDSDESYSSAVRLNRRNLVNMYSNNQANQLYGEKTNKETELLNQDALNQQGVRAQNIANYNKYLNDLVATKNARNAARTNAIQMGISGIGDSINNLIDQSRQNRADDMAMTWGLARLSDSNRNWALKHLDRRTRSRLGFGF